MEYFTGEHLRQMLVNKGLSFRYISKTLNFSKKEMDELFRSSRIERSLFREISNKLNLDVEIDPSLPDYIDPSGHEYELEYFYEVFRYFITDLEKRFRPYTSSMPGLASEFETAVKEFNEKIKFK